MEASMRISRSVEFFGSSSSSSFSSPSSSFEPEFQQKSLVLSDVLQNHTMLHFFQKFLEQEYSEENLLFYLEVERFRRLSNPDQLQSKALEIYASFVNPDTAPTLINLTQEVVAQIQLRLDPLIGFDSADDSSPPPPQPSSSSEDCEKDKEIKEKEIKEKRSSRYDSLSMRLRKSLILNDPNNITNYGNIQNGGKTAFLVTIDLFDQAALEVQGILERDSLPRFAKKSFSGTLRKPRRPLSSRLSTHNLTALTTHSLQTLAPKSTKNEMTHSGILKRRAGFFSSWKTFLYVMKSGSMFEYREGADIVKDNPLRVIRLKNVIVRNTEEMTGKANTFGLFASDDKRAYFFQALSEEDKNKWMTSLGANVTEFSPSQGADAGAKADLIKALPILQHLEIFNECVFVINDENLIVSANKAACTHFGYESDELEDKPIDMLFVLPLNPDQLVQDGFTHELEAKPHPDKLPFTVLLTMGRLQKGHLLVTITPKLGGPKVSSLKDVGRTNSSFF